MKSCFPNEAPLFVVHSPGTVGDTCFTATVSMLKEGSTVSASLQQVGGSVSGEREHTYMGLIRLR